MRNREISNTDDLIDSRDVIARIEELREQMDDDDSPELDADEQEEYNALVALQEQAEGYAADWRHGETLIRDSYFTEYAQELAEDIGAVKDDTGWPGRHIDWDAAADELKQDYTAVEFDGVTYWVR